MKKIIFIFSFFVITLQAANYNWYSVYTGTSFNINNITFFNSKIGWFCGENGLLKKSENSGLNWITKNSGSYYDLNYIDIISETETVIVGDSNVILFNNNQSLLNKTFESNISYNLTNCFFKNINEGWVVGDSNLIIYTNNQGLTWSKQYEGYEKLFYIKFFSESNYEEGIAFSKNTIFYSSNKGNDWTSYSNLYNTKFVFAFSINNIYIMADNYKIYRSSDKGKTWTYISQLENTVTSINFSDAFRGLATSTTGKIYQTIDGGNSWSEISSGISTKQLNSVSTINGDTIWTVGIDGTLFLRTKIEGSSNTDDLVSEYPVANAGNAYFGKTGETITLSSALTTSKDIATVKYDWSLIEDNNAVLINSTTSSPEFYTTQEGFYKIKLEITDFTKMKSVSFAYVYISNKQEVLSSNNISLNSSDTFNQYILSNNSAYNIVYNNTNDSVTIYFDIADYLTSPKIFYISKPALELFQNAAYTVSKYNYFGGSLISLDIFDSSTLKCISKNNIFQAKPIISWRLPKGLTQYDGKEFAVFCYSDTNEIWNKVSDYKIYDSNNEFQVTADLNHFSVYGIFPKISFMSDTYINFDSVKVYPNPFIPNDNNSLTGKNYSGSEDGSGIYISGLPLNTDVKIVNLMGHIVFQSNSGNNNYIQWSGKNKHSDNVKSGIYFVVTSSKDNKCVKKLMIIR